MLQPFELTRSDSTSHKMMVQFFFPPAGEIKLEDAVSRDYSLSVCMCVCDKFNNLLLTVEECQEK